MLLRETMVNLWIFRSNPIVLLNILNTFYVCSIKSCFESQNISECFWISDWVTLILLNAKEEWFIIWSLIPRKSKTNCYKGGFQCLYIFSSCTCNFDVIKNFGGKKIQSNRRERYFFSKYVTPKCNSSKERIF